MSKNVLKQAQERRKDRKEAEGAEDTSTADAMRDAILSREATDEQPTKRLNAEIPSRLHARFKAACQGEGKSMTTVLVQLVETYVELREE